VGHLQTETVTSIFRTMLSFRVFLKHEYNHNSALLQSLLDVFLDPLNVSGRRHDDVSSAQHSTVDVSTDKSSTARTEIFLAVSS
jgi:hypothetical protein